MQAFAMVIRMVLFSYWMKTQGAPIPAFRRLVGKVLVGNIN
jgi:hypothetical protein